MINLNANAKISFFMDTNFPYHDFHGEEQPIENSPINHEECSDDRPLKKDYMSIIEDVNIENPWEQHVVQVEERQENPKEESNENKKPLDEAVLPPEFKGVKEEQKPEDTGNGNDDRFDKLESILDSLFEKVEKFQVTIDKQQEIIKSQKREIERYHNDEVNEKIRKPMLLDLIEVMDSMDMALEDYDRNPQEAFLGERMEEIRKLMKATLENYGVREIDDAEKQPASVSRRQQVVGREESDNPELFEIAGEQVNSFYKRDRVGYVMCENDIEGEPHESVLRPEEVIRVSYRPREN